MRTNVRVVECVTMESTCWTRSTVAGDNCIVTLSSVAKRPRSEYNLVQSRSYDGPGYVTTYQSL